MPKSRKAPKKVRKALEKGAELIFVWGGDGMVQRCVDTLAGSGRRRWRSCPPAPRTSSPPTSASRRTSTRRSAIGLHGRRRRARPGPVNGEHFAVMAGAGFDGDVIREADRRLKGRLGRLAYVWTGARHVAGAPVKHADQVDGAKWFDGDASCVLFGNVGKISGGIQAFDDARPDDGCLEVGVSPPTVRWTGRAPSAGWPPAARRSHRSCGSPGAASSRSGSPRPARTSWTAAPGEVTKLKVRVVPGALTVCCPGPVP